MSTSVTIPSTLTEIEAYAFYNCSSLTSVTIPGGVNCICDGAFGACTALTTIEVAPDNESYSSLDGVLVDKSKTELIQYPAGKTGSYTIPDSVHTIHENAFTRCNHLTDMTIPTGVNSIENFAFLDCRSLSDVKILSKKTQIGDMAFGWCFEQDADFWRKEGFTVWGCIGSFAQEYAENNNFNFVVLEESYNGKCGEQLTWHFDPDTGTLTIEGSGPMENYGWVGAPWCDFLDKITTVNLLDGVSYIGACAFEGCSSLMSVTIPDSVTGIGDGAFQECCLLKHMIIPASVTDIAYYAFGWGWIAENGEADRVEDFIIYGIAGTAAENYAKNEGFEFVPLDPNSGFCDVDSNGFYYDAMLWAVQNGVTNGTSDVEFSPAEVCTRAQTMSFLWKANGRIEPTNTDTLFEDVDCGEYYFAPVCWAVERKITNGVDNTHFGSDSLCARAQVVTFLWRAAGSPEPEDDENPFVDVKNTADCYYYKAVLWAVEQGITNGTDETHFSPEETCTRCQVVSFLYRQQNN